MKKVWLYIKSNKVATIAVAGCVLLLLYIFWPVKKIESSDLNVGVARIIDSIVQVNNFKLIQQQQEYKKSVDSVLKIVSNNDAKIVEKIFYRENQIRVIDTVSEPVLQGLWDDRYHP